MRKFTRKIDTIALLLLVVVSLALLTSILIAKRSDKSQAAAISQLTALSPAKVWVGLKNITDIGARFDLKAEVYANGTLISSGQTDSVFPGLTGLFASAKLDTINFNSFSPVDFPPGSTLAIKLYVRNACKDSLRNNSDAKLWYNSSQANSGFGINVDGTPGSYYLAANSMLSSSVGTGPISTVDAHTGAKCGPFNLFGTWSITTPTPLPTPVFYCYCKDAVYWNDGTNSGHSCQIVQTSDNPSVNFNRSCDPTCTNPCTQ